VSGRATSVSDHDCVTGAFFHGVSDGSPDVLVDSGGV
jgi:hypothetical protein